MSQFFAPIYENWFGIYSTQHRLIFGSLFNHSGYFWFAMIFILGAVSFAALFYFVPKFPYAKWWHWLIWIFIGAVVVATITYGVANEQIFASPSVALQQHLNNSASDYSTYAHKLLWIYALVNSFLALVASLIFSIIFKRLPWSKVHSHLPFKF